MSGFKVPPVLWGLAAWGVLAAGISALAGWPAQFMTDMSTPEGFLGYLVAGSALSAPIGFIVAIAVVGALATRPGAVGWLGDILALVVAGISLVGSLGETFAADPVSTPRVVLIASGVIGVAFAVLIGWAVVHDIRLRRAAGQG